MPPQPLLQPQIHSSVWYNISNSLQFHLRVRVASDLLQIHKTLKKKKVNKQKQQRKLNHSI